MPIILKLRGATALSAFRLDKLNSQLAGVHRSVQVLGAEYWHFAELERPLSRDELGILQRLLDYGEGNAGAEAQGTLLLAVPRVGTISPWSSKATDIARRCGLDAVRRVERGVAYRLSGDREVSEQRAAILPLLHDRMTEAVFQDIDQVEALFRHF